MNRKSIVAAATLVALAFSACSVESLESVATEAPATAPPTTAPPATAPPATAPPTTAPPATAPPTTAPPATAPPATAPPTTAPPARAPAPDAFDIGLDYLGEYCYSDCSLEFEDRYDLHLAASSGVGLEFAVAEISSYSYSELDELCDEFWSTSDIELAAVFVTDGVDEHAALAILYYACDS